MASSGSGARPCSSRSRARGAARSADRWKVPATIDYPMIIEEIAESLKELGYAQGSAV